MNSCILFTRRQKAVCFYSMRATVTRLLDKGLKTRTRNMPTICDLQHQVDDSARPILVMASIEKSAVPVMGRLVHPHLSDVGRRTFTMHGYEVDKATGQLFGQAWEIEPDRR